MSVKYYFVKTRSRASPKEQPIQFKFKSFFFNDKIKNGPIILTFKVACSLKNIYTTFDLSYGPETFISKHTHNSKEDPADAIYQIPIMYHRGHSNNTSVLKQVALTMIRIVEFHAILIFKKWQVILLHNGNELYISKSIFNV